MTKKDPPSAEERILEELESKSDHFEVNQIGNAGVRQRGRMIWTESAQEIVKKFLPAYRKDVLAEVKTGVKDIRSHSSSSSPHFRECQKHLFNGILELLKSLK